MKTVTMTADFDYRPRSGVIIAYLAGRTYQRVPEAAVAAIKNAAAGVVVQEKITLSVSGQISIEKPSGEPRRRRGRERVCPQPPTS